MFTLHGTAKPGMALCVPAVWERGDQRMTTFTLPYPPSANRYWRSFGGHVVVSTEAKQYKASAALMARSSGVIPVDGDVVLHLDVYRPRKAGDLSNRIKVLEDALIGVAYIDDAQVVEIHARRFDEPQKKGLKRAGYVVVRVEVANGRMVEIRRS
jgi:crossover junction endodeoxyribonuclease RusA